MSSEATTTPALSRMTLAVCRSVSHAALNASQITAGAMYLSVDPLLQWDCHRLSSLSLLPLQVREFNNLERRHSVAEYPRMPHVLPAETIRTHCIGQRTYSGNEKRHNFCTTRGCISSYKVTTCKARIYACQSTKCNPTCNSACVQGSSDFQTGLLNFLLLTTCSGNSSNSLEQKQPIR